MLIPEYELGPLKAAVIQAKMNIAAFERGILKEEEHIRELGGYIKKWEEYNEENEQEGKGQAREA